ncbi:MAG: hypothetical protein SPJ70_04885, partial [Candidatus Borkfalkiaceae bacterium]|nr:hypothetical protein [Christensenellaceae bacterium]
MKFKKLAALLLCGATLFCAAACGGKKKNNSGEKLPDWAKNATVIKVQNFPGGIGRKWLDEAAERFQNENKTKPFETGKEGVYISISGTQPNSKTLSSSGYQIIFDERYSDIYELAQSNSILQLDDLMATEDASGRTLESRVYEGARDGLKGGDGHYYALPHYEWFPGLIYDKDAFDKYGWYIAKDGQGTPVENKYGSITITKTAANKSCGPDGKAGTEDDGLPSSLEELIVLCQKIKDDAKIAPFTVSGAILYNSNYLVEGLWASLAGYDELKTVYSLDGDVEVVTGFSSENLFRGINYIKKPITEVKRVTPSTGYLAFESAARYYATAFVEIMKKEGFLTDEATNTSVSHIQAQKLFIEGSMDGAQYKPRAFLIDGSYWYNESVDAKNFTTYDYLMDGIPREVRFTRLPVKVNGSVTEKAADEEADKTTLLDNGIAYAYINANIKNNTQLVEACKEFLKFLYSDEELRKFTACTGITRPVEYELDSSELNRLSGYQRD